MLNVGVEQVSYSES